MKERDKMLMVIKGLILVSLSQFVGAAETLYFLRAYGCHWSPINGWEEFWDAIAGLISLVGFSYVVAPFMIKTST